MYYRKYVVRTRLFALRDPRHSARVLAAFAGAAGTRLVPPPPARPRPSSEEKR